MKSIKSKLMLFSTTILLLIIVPVLWVGYHDRMTTLNDSAQTDLRLKLFQVIELLETSSNRAYALSELIAHLPEIQKMMAEKDRVGIENFCLPLYESIKKQVNVDKFQFHLPPATSFYRVHKPSKFGDDLSRARPTIVEVNRTQKPVVGLDKGPYGFGIRGLAPMFYQGRHLGSVEFGVGLNNTLLESLKAKYQFDAFIFAKNNDGYKMQASTGGVTIPVDQLTQVFDQVVSKNDFVYKDITIDGKHWLFLVSPLNDFSGKAEGVIVVPQNLSHMVASVNKLTLFFVFMGIGAMALGCGFSYFFITLLVGRPIKHISGVFKQVEQGDLTQRIETRKKNEISELGAIINEFLETIQSLMSDLHNDVVTLDDSSTSLSAISTSMSEKSRTVSHGIDSATQKMKSNVSSAATAVDQTVNEMETMSDSVDLLINTISEIGQNTRTTSTISNDAVEKSMKTSQMVKELENAVSQIIKITDTINDISDQTNLLALNATIEAARAGEAGKGFAVVANEIKDLAGQTASATLEIQASVDGIKQSNDSTILQIKDIERVIKDVNENVKNIETVVEKQMEATNAISSIIKETKTSAETVREDILEYTENSRQITENISELNTVASEMDTETGVIDSSAKTVMEISHKIKGVINMFRV
ncbi:methyl-accepting chemotaxis protein [uncultured Desulfobacter sp.]|uniref:methyl-accepting chemotaxis protein n=1 Tax=uncultured Desulfobacter sp. TaxID=240139 RepID=UPI002AAC4BA2|nr:methyl-accepting chemotaxis protein [uncultured Desulfobacter sp.]